jgi:hypothetical protein
MKTKKDASERSEHTPTPWTLLPARTLVNLKGPNGEQVGQLPINSADAAFIVRAVNSHEALLSACKQAMEDHEFDRQNESYGLMQATVNRMKKAIAQAEARP